MRRGRLVWLVAGLALAAGADEPVVRVEGDRLVASWAGAGELELRLSGPAPAGGRSLAEGGGPAELALPLDESGRLVAGLYRYELRSRRTGGLTRWGRFVVTEGRVRFESTLAEQLAVKDGDAPRVPDDYVVADDLVVSGRTCTGYTCTNGEPFGSEDLRLRSSVPQLRLEDTDGTDWMLEADSAALQLRNLSNSNVPLRIEPSAPTGSLHIDAGGDVGIGTAAPAASLHLRAPFSDASLALEDSAGGLWKAQLDVPLNGSRFTLRDPNGGSALSIVAQSSPSTPALSIEANGYVSLGGTGIAPLHLRRTDGAAKLVVEEQSATNVGRNMLQMKNNGAATFRFDNTATGQAWGFGSLNSGNFFMGSSPGQVLGLVLTPSGNVTITGTLTQGSDRHGKQDIEALEPAEVLERVAGLPIYSWRYKGDEALHAGPMAQDFHAAFGLGADDKHIAPGDMAGLSLAAVQALRAENRQLWDELQRRADETAALRAELQALREALPSR